MFEGSAGEPRVRGFMLFTAFTVFKEAARETKGGEIVPIMAPESRGEVKAFPLIFIALPGPVVMLCPPPEMLGRGLIEETLVEVEELLPVEDETCGKAEDDVEEELGNAPVSFCKIRVLISERWLFLGTIGIEDPEDCVFPMVIWP